MTSGNEIITLQFGFYSNFVGTHWWNLQECGFEYAAEKPGEINHDVLYREGQTDKGHVTFTPRLLLVDRKGSLNHLPQEGELYEKQQRPQQNSALWPEGRVEIVEEPQAERNEFIKQLDDMNVDPNNGGNRESINMERTVKVWSDFLVTRFHPNTVNIINEYQHDSSSQPFDVFTCGSGIWKEEHFHEDFSDRIRKYVEECDNMQGFHVLVDGTDGFAGLGASVVQYIADEYTSKSVLVFPTIPPHYPGSPAAGCVRALNLSLLLPQLAEHSSLVVPLSVAEMGWREPGAARSFPHVDYSSALPYHSAALLAAALDTATLGYRLRVPSARLWDVCAGLGRMGRRVAAASLGLPFPLQPAAHLLDALEAWEGPLWRSLTPRCALDGDRIWAQSVVLRGVPQHRLRNPEKVYREWNPAYTCSTIQEMLSLFLSCCSYATASQVVTVDTPCKVAPPFPQIFSSNVQVDGSVDSTPRPAGTRVLALPTIAGLHSSSSVGDMLDSLHALVAKLSLQRFHQFTTAGLESEEHTASLENLLALRDCYHEEFNIKASTHNAVGFVKHAN